MRRSLNQLAFSGVAGQQLKERCSRLDIVFTSVQWARRGYVQVGELEERGAGRLRVK
jgi:hypothetical protein